MSRPSTSGSPTLPTPPKRLRSPDHSSGDGASKHLNGHLRSIASAMERGGSTETEMRQLALPPNLLHYCKTIQRRFSNPLVEMLNGVCTGCFMALSSGQRQKIENETTYGVCESCGRILYYEEL